jgi:SulP family sulfate permease
MADTTAPRLPVLEGVLPIEKKAIPVDMVAGITLAALAIPEVMGYTSIAGMPVITGLYTILIPLLLYACLGGSRHLVVGADSATAAVMAAALTGMAAVASSEYVALAGLLALMAAAILLLARLLRLGFIADFLSRTVLVGFLTGVGIQVAMGQLAGMLGVSSPKVDPVSFTSGTIDKFVKTLGEIDDTSMTTLAVAVGVLGTILGSRAINKKIPGALIAVIGAIAISYWGDLSDHGVATLGEVPSGLPSFGFPDGLSWSDVGPLIPTALSIAVLILAQSAATSRAYAAKYDEHFSEDTDLVGLSLANVGACMTGTFVVNGSPTKTQMVDSAGGRTQIAQITAASIVAIVLLFLTAPLEYMPNAVLAAVVFLIGVELIDIEGMKDILRRRPDEFVVALITAATVVVVGVEQAIILAIIISIIDHLRRSYRPNNGVLSATPEGGGWKAGPVEPDARTEDGLIVYHFGADLYYANANRFLEEAGAFLTSEPKPRWICLDAASVFDVDFTAGRVINQLLDECEAHGVRFAIAAAPDEVVAELERYDLVDRIGRECIYSTVDEAVAAFGAAPAEQR